MKGIKDRISALQKEAEELVNQKSILQKTQNDIEIRLHQIIGAIQELNKLIQQGELINENDENYQPTVSRSDNEIK